jgi:hypothetical protein
MERNIFAEIGSFAHVLRCSDVLKGGQSTYGEDRLKIAMRQTPLGYDGEEHHG